MGAKDKLTANEGVSVVTAPHFTVLNAKTVSTSADSVFTIPANCYRILVQCGQDAYFRFDGNDAGDTVNTSNDLVLTKDTIYELSVPHGGYPTPYLHVRCVSVTGTVKVVAL